ncbi:uncharacterized protein CLUP02_09966 [Colletotrichum lupini]|uniref:Uncharacterized protein n=1 Tax=Colletotrichum lupini TaxID=145971 RepID=A0A9Q8SVV1_9PEZI|nr:uncharacterized protein CLUP02_09966 [Colletotrichum lupini]UQC84469.1 hypothetical protein CLUP02_09966 [Colletotrichum lupini]
MCATGVVIFLASVGSETLAARCGGNVRGRPKSQDEISSLTKTHDASIISFQHNHLERDIRSWSQSRRLVMDRFREMRVRRDMHEGEMDLQGPKFWWWEIVMGQPGDWPKLSIKRPMKDGERDRAPSCPEVHFE